MYFYNFMGLLIEGKNRGISFSEYLVIELYPVF